MERSILGSRCDDYLFSIFILYRNKELLVGYILLDRRLIVLVNV
jgi:hypothetical protein